MRGKLIQFCVTILCLLALWQGAVWAFEPPGYLFPSPAAVADVFSTLPGYLFANLWITVKEMIFGLVVGGIAGILVALVLSHIAILDRFLMPIVVVTQTLPVFAIAPLLVIWFGFGIGSKIVMAALIIFFPVASSFYDGLKGTPLSHLDVANSFGSSKLQTLLSVRIPAALPSLMSGFKIAATIAPIGAVVGEWAGAAGGLGFVMLQANARTQTAVVFAALLLLALSAYLLRWLVVKISDRLVWWSVETV